MNYYKQVLIRTWKGKRWDAWRLAVFVAFLTGLGILHFGLPPQTYLALLIAPFLFFVKCASVGKEMDTENSARIRVLESELSRLTANLLRVTNLACKSDGTFYLEIENLNKTGSQGFNAKILQALDSEGRTIAESWRLTGPDATGGTFFVPAGRSVKVNFAHKSGDIARLVGESNNVKLPGNHYEIKILFDNHRTPTEANLRFDGDRFYLLEGPDNPPMGPV